MKYYVLVLFFFALVSSTKASDTNGMFHVLGEGAKSCAVLSNTLDEVAQLSDGELTSEVVIFSGLLGWLRGYLTATNQFVEETYDITGGSSREEILIWVADFCDENLNESIVNAVQKFVIESHASRLKVEPK